MTLTQRAEISSSKPRKERNMEKVRGYRAMGQLCRQQAVFHPDMSWHWLGQAERWEDLAEIALHFRECHSLTTAPSNERTHWAKSEAA
jgi:hypothetical protein